jgi:hypothetical protein
LIPAVWLVLSTLLYSLQLNTGSFPRPLSEEEERKYLQQAKEGNLVGNMASQGTTPRQLTDLIGSLCDLTSGSGDKGTPVVLVQGYFDNYTT